MVAVAIIVLITQEPFGETLSFTDPRFFLIAGGGVGMFIYVMRQMVLYQRHFTNFYILENTRLRERVDELEKEVEAARDENYNLRSDNMVLKVKVNTISAELAAIKQRFDDYISSHP